MMREKEVTDLVILPTRAEVNALSEFHGYWGSSVVLKRERLANLSPVARAVIVSEQIGGGLIVPLFPLVDPDHVEEVVALDPLIHLVELTEVVRDISRPDSDFGGLETYRPWPWAINRSMAVRRALIRLRNGNANRELNLDPGRVLCYVLTLLEEEGNPIAESMLWDFLGHDFVAYILVAVRDGWIEFDLDQYGLSPVDILADDNLGISYERSLSLGYDGLESELFDRFELIRVDVAEKEEARLEEIKDDLGVRVERVEEVLKRKDLSVEDLLGELGM